MAIILVGEADNVFGILLAVPSLEYLDDAIDQLEAASYFPVTINMPCGHCYTVMSKEHFPKNDVSCGCGNPNHWFVKVEIDPSLDRRVGLLIRKDGHAQA